MALLKTLTEPYASIKVAVYEPLIVKWLSVPSITGLLLSTLKRAVAERADDIAGGASAPTIARFDWRAVEADTLDGDPRIIERIYRPQLGGVLVRPSARSLRLPEAEFARRREIVRSLITDDNLDLTALVKKLDIERFPHFITAEPTLHLALSPIGVAHLYRQLYFDQSAGLGPIEHAFTIAPKETMEVVQEQTRRESIERTETFGTETTLEKSAEEKTTEEISDHVQNTLRRDMQVGVSASAEGTIGVWSASAQGSLNLAQSSERAREVATTRSVSQTKKSSEVIRKTYSLSVKSFTEFSERSTIKRTITNEEAEPVNYGLRRVLRTIKVKLQDLGPRLVWQLYVSRPGERLAKSKLVMFRESDQIAPAGAPNAPPRPQGGVEAGSQTVTVLRESASRYIEITVPVDPARTHTGIIVDSITDASPEKDATAPGIASSNAAGTSVTDSNGNVVATRFKLYVSGSARVVNVSYSVSYQPSQQALDVWNQQMVAAQLAWKEEAMEAAFDRAKRLITIRSRVQPRLPAICVTRSATRS